MSASKIVMIRSQSSIKENIPVHFDTDSNIFFRESMFENVSAQEEFGESPMCQIFMILKPRHSDMAWSIP